MVCSILRVMVFIQDMRSAVILFPSGFAETIIAGRVCMGVPNGPVPMRVALTRVSAGVTNRRVRKG
jgi:hypothetical protein